MMLSAYWWNKYVKFYVRYEKELNENTDLKNVVLITTQCKLSFSQNLQEIYD